jgi:NitT/TauT family transport system substrate-binding protein
MNKRTTCRLWVITAGTLIALMGLLSSCGGGKKGGETIPPLRLGAMSSMDYLPYVVAQKTGIYDSLGLELEVVKFFSANDRDAAFRAGQVDGTVIDFTGAAIQQAAGMPLALIARHDGYFKLMADPTLTTMEDLRGKRLAVSRNTVIDYATDLMLRAAGIEPDEVQKPEVQKIPLRMEMMLAGEVDASVFPDPFHTIATSRGFTALSSTRDLGISVVGTMMRRETLDEKAEAVKILLEGYNLGVDYLTSHPIEDIRSILIEDAGVPEELVEQVVLPEYRHAILPQPKDLEETLRWLHEHDLIPADYTGEELVDGSFLPEA